MSPENQITWWWKIDLFSVTSLDLDYHTAYSVANKIPPDQKCYDLWSPQTHTLAACHLRARITHLPHDFFERQLLLDGKSCSVRLQRHNDHKHISMHFAPQLCTGLYLKRVLSTNEKSNLFNAWESNIKSKYTSTITINCHNHTTSTFRNTVRRSRPPKNRKAQKDSFMRNANRFSYRNYECRMFYASAESIWMAYFTFYPRLLRISILDFLIKLWDSRQRHAANNIYFCFNSCIVDIDAIILFTSAMCVLRVIHVISVSTTDAQDKVEKTKFSRVNAHVIFFVIGYFGLGWRQAKELRREETKQESCTTETLDRETSSILTNFVVHFE